MNPRVVFDTNVLFSATGWSGNPSKCVEAVYANRMDGLTCVGILEELAEKLAAKLNFATEQVDIVLGSFLSKFELITISGTMTGLQPDPKDDMILECAVVGNATHVVTGDRKHLLPLKRFRGIEIVSPAELLRELGQ